MRLSSGKKACSRKSIGGACGLCVPPSSVSDDGVSAMSSAGSTVCNTSVVLPAEPIEKVYSPGFTFPGVNESSRDEIAAPSTVAPQIVVAALTAVRCWRSRPGFSRPARMFSIRNGWPVTIDRPRAVRRIWPPPSPMEPSMRIMDSVVLRNQFQAAGLRCLVLPAGVLNCPSASGWTRLVNWSGYGGESDRASGGRPEPARGRLAPRI